jgi:hypothetical protein
MTILNNLFNKIQGNPEEELATGYANKISTFNMQLQGLDALMKTNTHEQGLMSIVGFMRSVDDWKTITDTATFKNIFKRIERISATNTELQTLHREIRKINTACEEILGNTTIFINKNLDGVGNISTHSVMIKIPGSAARTVSFLQKLRGHEEIEAGIFCADFIHKYTERLIKSTENIKTVLGKNTVTT